MRFEVDKLTVWFLMFGRFAFFADIVAELISVHFAFKTQISIRRRSVSMLSQQ